MYPIKRYNMEFSKFKRLAWCPGPGLLKLLDSQKQFIYFNIHEDQSPSDSNLLLA